MNIDLSGKKAIVTGSTGGIGFGIALGLARAGGEVVLNGRDNTKVAAAVMRLKDEAPGSNVRGVASDVGTAQGCDRLVSAEPRTDILVNNVGVYGQQDFFTTPDADWERFFALNVLSGVRLSRAYLPAMKENGWGRVLFLSSESALNIPADMIHYGVTKTADLALSRGLAKRMAGTGVTVNAILPGPTLSEGVRDMLSADPGHVRQVARGDREGVGDGATTKLHHPESGYGRGGGQPGGLSRVPALVSDDGRRLAGGWRRGGDPRVRT